LSKNSHWLSASASSRLMSALFSARYEAAQRRQNRCVLQLGQAGGAVYIPGIGQVKLRYARQHALTTRDVDQFCSRPGRLQFQLAGKFLCASASTLPASSA
jgi:hypothetical protein